MMCERFIQTLFNKVARYMTDKNTLKFYNRLPNFTKSYNNTFHTTIKKRPNDINDDNWMETWHEVYAPMYKPDIKTKARFTVGQTVRISIEKGIFDKGSKSNFSNVIFVIDKIREGNPTVYYLKNLKNEKLTDQFYSEELVAVPAPSST